MNIEEARKLRIGSHVMCPPDRGDRRFSGPVVFISGIESVDGQGQPYIWVTVERRQGHRSVWPSNRLGLVRL